jgi:hypothetical protein
MKTGFRIPRVLLALVLLVLSGCARASSPAPATPIRGPNLQATVSALQTQVAQGAQSAAPAPASIVTPAVQPAAGAAPTALADPAQGYLAKAGPCNEPGVYYLQWLDTGGNLVGDLRSTTKKDYTAMQLARVKGGRTGATGRLVAVSMGGGISVGASIDVYRLDFQGNALNLSSEQPHACTAPWAFQTASEADYQAALSAFVESKSLAGGQATVSPALS